MMTLAGVLCGAAAPQPAVTDPAGTIDYVGLCNAADAVAAALAARGVVPGDRVAAAFPDGAAFLAGFAGTAVARAAFAPVAAAAADDAVRAQLRALEPRLLLASADAPQGLRVAAAALGIPVVSLAFGPDGVALVDGEPVYEAHGRLADADDVAFIAPDGATYTHAALVDAALAASERTDERQPVTGLAEPAGLIGALGVLSRGGHLVLQGALHAAAA